MLLATAGLKGTVLAPRPPLVAQVNCPECNCCKQNTKGTTALTTLVLR